MIIPVNSTYRVASEARQWILQERSAQGEWTSVYYFGDGIALIDCSTQYLPGRFRPEDWNMFRQVLAPMARLRHRVESALQEVTLTHKHFLKDGFSVPIGDWALVDADTHQFRVCRPKMKKEVLHWEPGTFHRRLDDALNTAFMRRCRQREAEGVDACVAEVNDVGAQILASMLVIGRRYVFWGQQIAEIASLGEGRRV